MLTPKENVYHRQKILKKLAAGRPKLIGLTRRE
jgi:hypothetical protein